MKAASVDASDDVDAVCTAFCKSFGSAAFP